MRTGRAPTAGSARLAACAALALLLAAPAREARAASGPHRYLDRSGYAVAAACRPCCRPRRRITMGRRRPGAGATPEAAS